MRTRLAACADPSLEAPQRYPFLQPEYRLIDDSELLLAIYAANKESTDQ